MESIKRVIQSAMDSGPGKGPSDERGAALITALLFLVILTAIGMASVMTSSTETLISRNYRLNKLATDYATAGLNVAMARMDLVGTGSALAIGYNISIDKLDAHAGWGDSVWTVRSTDFALPSVPGVPGVTAETGGPPVSFSGSVAYRKEDQDDHWRDITGPAPAAGAEKVVAYSQDCGYDKAPLDNWHKAFPVYTIEMTGKVLDSDGRLMATQTVLSDVTRNTLNIYAPGGMYSGECPTINGAGNTATGETGVPAVVTGGTGCADSGDINSMSGSDVDYSTTHDMATYLGYDAEELKAFAAVFPYPDARDFGEPNMEIGSQATNDPAIWFLEYTGPALDESLANKVENDFTLNNCIGYGVLIISGDLVINGTFNWKGLVYVFGDVTLGGGGAEAKNIQGAIMCSGEAVIGGNLSVNYDSDILEAVSAAGFESKLLNWRVSYDMDAPAP